MYLGQIYKKISNLQNKPSYEFYFLDAIKEFINFVAMLLWLTVAQLLSYIANTYKRDYHENTIRI